MCVRLQGADRKHPRHSERGEEGVRAVTLCWESGNSQDWAENGPCDTLGIGRMGVMQRLEKASRWDVVEKVTWGLRS